MKVYGDIKSGNCYKIKLVASLLGIEHEWIHVDILNAESRTPEFLAMNPNGKVPVVELDDGRHLWESNAIVNFLAAGTRLLPRDPFELARVQQWQFFEQYSHEPYIATARYIATYLGLPDERRAEYEAKQSGGHSALGVMERQLKETPYLVGNDLTTADISLFAYTHVADEGGFDLAGYPAILEWIARIQSLPNYTAMQ